ncbi:MAG: hypothetical protein MJZ61_07285, partial [Bacteroidales bacterium]|nr:hypothetical protein [Bacteroidales bacterium]
SLETGDYYVRIKGNANKNDEYTDFKIHLYKDKSYDYSANIKELNEKFIAITNFSWLGTKSSTEDDKKQIKLIDLIPFNITTTNGVTIDTCSNYKLISELVGNEFNSIVTQLFDNNMNYIENLNQEWSKGWQKIQYTHNKESGIFNLVIRANSNLRDEYITINLDMEKNQKYLISYQIKKNTHNKIVISDITTSKIQ